MHFPLSSSHLLLLLLLFKGKQSPLPKLNSFFNCASGQNYRQEGSRWRSFEETIPGRWGLTKLIKGNLAKTLRVTEHLRFFKAPNPLLLPTPPLPLPTAPPSLRRTWSCQAAADVAALGLCSPRHIGWAVWAMGWGTIVFLQMVLAPFSCPGRGLVHLAGVPEPLLWEPGRQGNAAWASLFHCGGNALFGFSFHFSPPKRPSLMLPTSALFHLACVQNLFLSRFWFSLNRKLTKWPHLPRPGFVHKGNLDLRPPCWGVPLLPALGWDHHCLPPAQASFQDRRKKMPFVAWFFCFCFCFAFRSRYYKTCVTHYGISRVLGAQAGCGDVHRTWVEAGVISYMRSSLHLTSWFPVETKRLGRNWA